MVLLPTLGFVWEGRDEADKVSKVRQSGCTSGKRDQPGRCNVPAFHCEEAVITHT